MSVSNAANKETDVLLWATSEVARQLQVSTKTISRLIAQGQLPFIHIGSSIRIQKTDVFEYLERQKRYNLGRVGSAVQEKSTCHINAKKVRIGGHRSLMQTAKELDVLLEPPSARKRKP